MKQLVHALADMCSLRDRDELDASLIQLVLQEGKSKIASARLSRAEGSEADGSADYLHVTRLPVQVTKGQELPNVYLDVVSAKVLSADLRETVEALIRIYRNFAGLLDYGEKDTLTELLNRKTFDGAFFKAAVEQRAMNDAADEGQDRRDPNRSEGYWLAVLDIDHFKRVNDNFGHLIGDEVLLLIARLMRANFRFQDLLYRFGGEEFVILMRCAGKQDAANALERFRKRVESHDFPQVGNITVSVGFAPLLPDDTPGTAFDRADKAVYYAKGNGRNQVSSYVDLVANGELAETIEDTKEVDFF